MNNCVLNIAQHKILNSEELNKVLHNCKDGKYLLTLKDYRKRSLSQNAYYWAVCVPMIRQGLYDAGYDEITTDDEAHEVIKSVLLKKNVVSKQTGEIIEVSGSTAKLSISDFNLLIERIIKWAAEYLNVIIPSPEDPVVILSEYSETLEHD